MQEPPAHEAGSLLETKKKTPGINTGRVSHRGQAMEEDLTRSTLAPRAIARLAQS
jgi:hypothetical protein